MLYLLYRQFLSCLRRIIDVNHVQRKMLAGTAAFALDADFNIECTDIIIAGRTAKGAGRGIEIQPFRQWLAICQTGAVAQLVVLVGRVEGIFRKGVSQLVLFMNALCRQRFACGWCFGLIRYRPHRTGWLWFGIIVARLCSG